MASKTLQFDSFWDELAGVWRVSVFGLEKEAVNLPGAAKAHGGPLYKYTLAAVTASPLALSDDLGLHWATESDARKAAAAASKTRA